MMDTPLVSGLSSSLYGDTSIHPVFGWLPSQLPNLKLWTRFGEGITTATGVSQWDDQSGNGNHLKQATGANQPSLEADGSILFDGVDNYLKADAFTLIQPETIYILGKQVTWTSGGRLFDGNTLNSGACIQTVSTPDIYIYAGSGLTANSDFTLDTYGVLSTVIDGASSSLKINNGTETTGDTGAGNMGGFTLGANGGNTQWANIQVKEVLIYSVAHDAATRAKVIAYLQSI